MAGLTRYLQKLFGTSAGSNQMSEYGSRIASPPGNLYSGSTITPDIVQSLSAFQGGQFSAIGGAYSPFIEDHNSLFYLAFYQLSYILTRGIPEWDSSTTYNTNDFCKIGNVIYYSLIDNNTNNSPTSNPLDWQPNTYLSPTQQIFDTAGSGTYTAPAFRPLYLHIKMVGAGGGGSGAVRGSPISTSAGGNGGSTLFFPNNLEAGGGNGGVINSSAVTPGAGGGTAFTAGIGKGYFGQEGGFGTQLDFGTTGFFMTIPGGNGGQNLFAGAGLGGGGSHLNGKDAITNSGSGGGGGGIETSIPDPAGDVYISGVGGGAGGYLDIILGSPASSYAYTIGAGGAGGTGVGATSGNGGKGSDGLIIVTEYYQ